MNCPCVRGANLRLKKPKPCKGRRCPIMGKRTAAERKKHREDRLWIRAAKATNKAKQEGEAMTNAVKMQVNGKLSLWEIWDALLRGKTVKLETPFVAGEAGSIQFMPTEENEAKFDQGSEFFVMTAVSVYQEPTQGRGGHGTEKSHGVLGSDSVRLHA